MSKAVKLVNNQYLSTQYVVHKRGGGWYYLNNLLDNIYPIGSIFISTNTTNPSTYFGGKWERIKGRFLLAANDSTYKIGSTGGEASHKLTINEMPSHNHRFKAWAWGYNRAGTTNYCADQSMQYDNFEDNGSHIANTGGNQPHNNMPPYLVVYIWKRIS